MTIVKIQYTVQAGFAERNKQNIAKVMEELRSANKPGIRYSAYILDDGKTFVHFVIARDEDPAKIMGTIESFKHFQADLKGSNPEIPPAFENLTMVGSSFDVFD